MLIKKAQNTAEYAILFALVIAAVIGMQTYVKRGIQARVADTSDDFVTAVSDPTGWAALEEGGPAVAAVTAEYQFEDERISSKSTQDIIKDEEVYTMDTGGTTIRETTKKTSQAEGDYQEVGY